MSKTKLEYTVRTTRAPGETADSWVPMIVDRLQPTDLASVVEKCIDRGLIAGLKPTAAQTIADGVAQQLVKEFSEGRGVQFGQYFYGRPYLDGTVGSDGKVGEGNRINVRLYKGALFGLTLDDFSLSFADGGNSPKINFVVGRGTEPRGTVEAEKGVSINGSMLWGAGDTVKVKFAEVGGSAVVEVVAFASLSAELISFDWPPALVAGKSYGVTVERTDPNGKTLTTNAKTVSVVAGATPPADPPVVTGYVADGMEHEPINLDGGELGVTGVNLAGATAVRFSYTEDGDAFYEMPVSESSGTSATGTAGYGGTVESEDAFLRVVTPGGTSNAFACDLVKPEE